MKKSRLGLRIFLSVITTIVMFMLTINVIPPSKVVDYNPFLKQGEKLPMVAAHRGGATTNPQNTMKAFKSAVNEYQVDIAPSRKNKEFLSECQFIAHPNFIKPSDEYFHWKTEDEDHFQMCCLDIPSAIDLILKGYRYNNLRKSVFYQLPREEMEAHKDNLRPIYEKYYVSFMKNYNPDEH